MAFANRSGSRFFRTVRIFVGPILVRLFRAVLRRLFFRFLSGVRFARWRIAYLLDRLEILLQFRIAVHQGVDR